MSEKIGMADPKIIVALDFPEPSQALALADALDPRACRLKVGKEMFTRSGPALVEELQSKGFEIFLDLKFHDIPNTVARACRAAADLGVWMVNVHALGGRRMMEAAREALANCERRPLLIAVTVLTSMDQDDVREVGLMGTPWDNVERLAALARSSGLDGVVCSAQEAVGLRRSLGEDFTLVTPGIRLANAAPDDQRRTMTPLEALRSGASYLVMGRPITGSDDPCTTLRTINSEISVMTKASS